MKENEVMIGDWVRIVDDDTDAFFDARVEGIDTLANVYVTMPCDETAYPYSVDCAKPIPITPEILEKNGFVMAERDGVAVRYSFATDLDKPKQTAIQFAFYDGGVSADTLFKCWTSPKDCDGINDLHICDLKFVHELQHAIRLAGIEKEIII